MRKDSDSSPHNRKKAGLEGGRVVGEKQKVNVEKKRGLGEGRWENGGPENGIKEGGKSQVGLGLRSRRGSTGRKE